jgi:outer membrane protein
MRSMVVLLALCGAPAFAQERPASDGWGLAVGAGGLATPTYEGDDAYRLSVLPNIQITYADTFFASMQDGVGYRVINTDGLRAGPIARIRFSRDENGDQPFAVTGENSTDLIGLGDVDTSFELGGFVGYRPVRQNTKTSSNAGKLSKPV